MANRAVSQTPACPGRAHRAPACPTAGRPDTAPAPAQFGVATGFGEVPHVSDGDSSGMDQDAEPSPKMLSTER